MRYLGGLFALMALALPACASATHSEQSAGHSAATSTPAESSSADAGTLGSSPGSSSLRARCLSLTPRGGGFRVRVIDRHGLTIATAVAEPKRQPKAIAILLPQVNSGLCGWLKYAKYLAEQQVMAVAVDLCGYGEGECAERFLTRPAPQVRAVLRSLPHPQVPRVLVGASMGGSQTVRAVAAGVPVARWVDLSGPSQWDDVALADVAAQIHTPGLIVFARDEPAAEFRAARRLAVQVGARWREVPAAHGWDLLLDGGSRPTRVGREIAAFVRGD